MSDNQFLESNPDPYLVVKGNFRACQNCSIREPYSTLAGVGEPDYSLKFNYGPVDIV